MRRRKRRIEELKVRFYAPEDNDLIEWVQQFDDPRSPWGSRQKVAREALRKGLNLAEPAAPAVAPPAMDLGELRRVVQAAVAEALGRFEGPASRATISAAEGDEDEVEFFLDKLASSLMVDDEEEERWQDDEK